MCYLNTLKGLWGFWGFFCFCHVPVDKGQAMPVQVTTLLAIRDGCLIKNCLLMGTEFLFGVMKCLVVVVMIHNSMTTIDH